MTEDTHQLELHTRMRIIILHYTPPPLEENKKGYYKSVCSMSL